MPPHSVTRGLPAEVDRSMVGAAQLVGFDTPNSNVISDWQGLPSDHPLSAIRPYMLRCGIRASLTVPLQGESGSIGGLSVADGAPRTWSADEIALTEAIGQQVGAAAERLRLITQIQEQALQVQGIINSVPEGVVLLSSDMRALLVNPPASEYLLDLANARLGDTLSHLGGRPLPELLDKPREGLWHEVELYEPAHRSFEVVVRPIEAGPAAGRWVMVMRDVTEEREAQRRVQRQEQLAVVGQLAAGIAHDFNNIMAVITLYSQVAQRTPDLPLETQERLRTVDQQARRAADLIQQILDFSRRSVLERHPLDMVPMLKEQVKLLERTLPESIQIELTYGPGDYTIHADPTRIQQVIINLALNARDAMPDGGRLHLSLERLQITQQSRLPLPEIEAGPWLRMTVSDTGTGISADSLPHIFEPFFTTKEVGKGTGLGLAQVYGIVKQHGGHIDLESQVGRGTTFTIYLPALPVPKLQPEEPGSRELTLGRGETVLVVEDNHATRQALVASLEMLNYQALEAGNGQDALSILKQRQSDISLVICDLVMPQMGGLELALSLMEVGSEAKVIIISGHPIQDDIDSLREQGVHTWLQKPIDLDQLAQVVARALQE
jgi:two-component system cell cycle sensor histidine kinase/response regulator CckA